MTERSEGVVAQRPTERSEGVVAQRPTERSEGVVAAPTRSEGGYTI